MLKQALVRAVRTFAQTAIGVWLAGQVANPMLADLANIDLLNAAAAAGVVAVLAFVQNALESWRAVDYDRG